MTKRGKRRKQKWIQCPEPLCDKGFIVPKGPLMKFDDVKRCSRCDGAGEVQVFADQPERAEYRNYTIWYDPPPIPLRQFDWHFSHVDYDLGDDRHGDGKSLEDCKAQIDEMETS